MLVTVEFEMDYSLWEKAVIIEVNQPALTKVTEVIKLCLLVII